MMKNSKPLFFYLIIGIFIIFSGCVHPDQNEKFPDPSSAPAQCQKTLESGGDVTVDEMQNASTICTNADTIITLRLKENSRTGLQWQLTASQGLEVIDNGAIWYDENNLPTRMPGIKGVHEWNIRAKKTGIQTIKAILRRSEGVPGSEPVFYLNVMVK
jgi:predicted secreted protein